MCLISFSFGRHKHAKKGTKIEFLILKPHNNLSCSPELKIKNNSKDVSRIRVANENHVKYSKRQQEKPWNFPKSVAVHSYPQRFCRLLERQPVLNASYYLRIIVFQHKL